MSEAITLTVPFERRYQGVIRLVLGGLAARLDLPYETLEDVQLAVETILANETYAAGDEVSLELQVGDDALAIAVGPLRVEAVSRDLEAPDGVQGIGLARLLAATMGGHAVEARGDEGWLTMRRALAEPREATA